MIKAAFISPQSPHVHIAIIIIGQTLTFTAHSLKQGLVQIHVDHPFLRKFHLYTKSYAVIIMDV